MFSIGINLAGSAGLFDFPIDPYLLTRRFDFRQFLKFVSVLVTTGTRSEHTPRNKSLFAEGPLFPGLNSLDIVALTNSRLCGPVACAADDLELFAVDGPDQIEFFDNYFMPTTAPRARFHSNPEDYAGYEYGVAEPHGAENYDLVAFNDFSPTTSLSLLQPLSLLSSIHYEHPYNGTLAPKQQPPFVQIQSAVDMLALQPNPYFNDFKQSVPVEGASMSGSSSESYASPLDDMFFKKPGGERNSVAVDSVVEDQPVSRKRKHNSASAPQFFPQMIYQEEEGAINSSELELPCNLTFEPSKKVRLDSFSRVSSEDDERKEFTCKHCDASFKVKSYLTRHMRKHNNAKAFVCPFFEESENESCSTATSAKNGTKCHPTGGFSRRDTYKTHLRALHFIYPPGTKSSERNSIGGRCAGCFEFFENNASWLKNHIEGGACRGAVGSDERYVKLESN